MGRAARTGALLAALLLAAGPSVAQQVVTTIDLDYTYGQRNDAGDVFPSVTYNQTYEAQFGTILTSTFEMQAKASLVLQDSWSLRDAHTARVSPALEMDVKGAQSSWKTTYETILSTTDAFQELGEQKTFSTDFQSELGLMPDVWPDLTIRYKHNYEHEPFSKQGVVEGFDLQTIKDFSSVRTDFMLNTESSRNTLPGRDNRDSLQWQGRVSYREVLFGGTRFDVAYDVREGVDESWRRGVFVGDGRDYSQKLRALVGNTLALSARTVLDLTWEGSYEQDLLALDYDYNLDNKYGIKLTHQLMRGLKISAGAERAIEHTEALEGEDDEDKVVDTLRASVDLEPFKSVRVSSRAEFRMSDDVPADSGRSVEEVDEEKYETILKHKAGSFWDLTLNVLNSRERQEGWLVSEEARFKADLRMALVLFSVQPTYDVARTTEWGERRSDFQSQESTQDLKIKFEFQRQLLGLVEATFLHEYGVRLREGLDEARSFEESAELNEDTRLRLVAKELFPDTSIEGEVQRKGSDTRDDTDPMLVDLAYALKIDWKHKQLSLSTTFKYNDKGSDFDDLSLSARLGWAGDYLTLDGTYEFAKVFAEETSETRKLQLHMKYRF